MSTSDNIFNFMGFVLPFIPCIAWAIATQDFDHAFCIVIVCLSIAIMYTRFVNLEDGHKKEIKKLNERIDELEKQINNK